jgi:hypothetical protein
VKYLALFEHRDTPKGAEEPFNILKQDMQKGIIKEFGAFVTNERGFLIRDVENEDQDFIELTKYNKSNVHFLSAGPFLSIVQLEKIFS